MRITKLSFLAVALPPILATNLSILNACNLPIYIATDARDYWGPHYSIPKGGSQVLPLDAQHYANSVKFSLFADNFDQPISFDYTIENGVVYYDVSDAALPDGVVGLYAVPIKENGEFSATCEPVGCPGPRCREVRGCAAEWGFQVIACPKLYQGPLPSGVIVR